MKNLLIIIMLISILGCSNNDDDASLPEATQTGENTAGCLVDGEILVPKGSSLGGPRLRAFYQRDENGFHFGLIIANNSIEPQEYVNIIMNDTLVEGESYNLISQVLDKNGYTSNFGEYIVGLRPDYITTDTQVGQVTITKLDTQRKIISGTFWFDAIHFENKDVVEVRDGRFDMRYVN
ncbi:hypothetical protein SAMN03097699_2788 [Flavobacteriaceae bacterium MAR_2010_188]|nr:hypothetical protein SAMN03097699_2788 [Flavobacteriaceae bacterium MAR_2010_188]